MRVQLSLSRLWKRVEMYGCEYMLALAADNNRYYLLSDDPELNGHPNDIRIEYGFRYSWVDESRNDVTATFELSNVNDSKAAKLMRLINDGVTVTTEAIDFYLPGVDGGRIYSGVKSYHSHRRRENNTMRAKDGKKYPYLVGVELEVETNNSDCYNWIDGVTSNWFYLETDGSLRNKGVEIITIPLTKKVACDPKTWEKLAETLSEKGATSHNNGRCGLHVHISRTGFGRNIDEVDETLGKLFHLYNNELGADGYGTNYIRKVMRRGFSSYCGEFLKDEKKIGFQFAQIAGMGSISSDGRKKLFKGLSQPQSERYEAINRQNNETIEFRQGRGTLRVSSIVTTIQFCCEIVEFCRTATAQKCTRDNFFKRIKNLSKNNPLRQTLINSEDI
jgi:hypothetical protein